MVEVNTWDGKHKYKFHSSKDSHFLHRLDMSHLSVRNKQDEIKKREEKKVK